MTYDDPNSPIVAEILATLKARGVDEAAVTSRQFFAWLHAVAAFLGVNLQVVQTDMYDRAENAGRRTPPLTDEQLKAAVDKLAGAAITVSVSSLPDDWRLGLQALSRVAWTEVAHLPRLPEALTNVTDRRRGVS